MTNVLKESDISFVDSEDIKKIPDVSDLQTMVGQHVDTEGAIHTIRNMNQVAFVIIRTCRDRVQVVLEGSGLELLDGLQEGDFVKVSGTVVANNVVHKGIEISGDAIKKIGGPKEPLPLKLGKKTIPLDLDSKLNERVLTLRHLNERAVFKLQEGVARAFAEYMTTKGFTNIHSPKLVEAGAEGGANIFNLDYFGKKAFLAQSPQFYKQFMVPVFGKVFEIGPVFRAEKHNTSRHVNEYTSMDCEMGYIDSFRDIMSVETGFLRYLVELLQREYADELETLGIKLPNVGNIPAIRFEDAKNAVAKRYNRTFRDKFDMEPEEEKLISKYIADETGSDFAFVTNYPWKKRPFYTMRSADNPDYTEGFDLLFRGIEITTGGQRIHDYDMQIQAMMDKGLNPADFEQYLKLHKYGVPPHGGFGLGLERLTMKLLGKDNIREATLFPRDVDRLSP